MQVTGRARESESGYLDFYGVFHEGVKSQLRGGSDVIRVRPVRARVIIPLSVALNVILGAMLWKALQFPVMESPSVTTRRARVAEGSTNSNPKVVVRRQFFNWSEIESDDYPTFIANLRRIGCPELTIRDIIVADVNQLYAQRRAQQVVTAESEWWKSEPDLSATETALKKISDLEKEKAEFLTKLLGPNWNVNFTQVSSPGTVALDGPVLGKLDPDTKLKVEELAATAGKRSIDYVEAQRAAGKAIDPAELARLRSEHRAELAKLLTPDQLEEYLLRHSAEAESLRDQLRGFNATPDEFRAIFRARDAIDNDIQLRYSGNDPASVRARQELEKKRDDAVAGALGPDRSALYRATADPIFREAQFLAQQSGATPEKVLPLYQVQALGARERARIAADTSLTPDQRAQQIREVEAQEETAQRKILGIPDTTAEAAE